MVYTIAPQNWLNNVVLRSIYIYTYNIHILYLGSINSPLFLPCLVGSGEVYVDSVMVDSTTGAPVVTSPSGSSDDTCDDVTEVITARLRQVEQQAL